MASLTATRSGLTRGPRPLTRPVLILLYLAFLFLLLEGAGFLLTRLPSTRSRLFSAGRAFADQLRGMEARYARFVAERYDPVLGWDNPRGGTLTVAGCRRGPVTASFLEDRSRRTTDIATGPPILVFGDSYTGGDGVDDADSYPAQLSRLLGRRVVNHGVAGYGPLQAMLKFQHRAADYADARSVVLGITNENFFRMLNSYRPVLRLHTQGIFAFQPFMRNGVPHANPNSPDPVPFDALAPLVRQAFREDYWALAEPRFPYAWALFDSLRRPAMRLRLLATVAPARVLEVTELRRDLEALLESFVASARAARMAPVVLLIPHRPHLRGVFDSLVPELRARLGVRVVVASVRDEGYRWADYLSGPHCHPGVYGYGIIAEHAARALREAEGR